MKFLKVDNNTVSYTIDGSEWKAIDTLGKEDLLILLNKALENDFEMDKYEPDEIGNQSHKIIYENIYTKFSALVKNKDRFRDESEALYKEAIEKYSQ